MYGYDDLRKRAFIRTCADLMEAAGVNVVEGFDAFRALMLACAWALANRAEAGGGLDKADLDADRKLAEEAVAGLSLEPPSKNEGDRS